MRTDHGFSFPSNPFWIYGAQRGGTLVLRGLDYLGCVVNEAIVVIKNHPLEEVPLSLCSD